MHNLYSNYQEVKTINTTVKNKKAYMKCPRLGKLKHYCIQIVYKMYCIQNAFCSSYHSKYQGYRLVQQQQMFYRHFPSLLEVSEFGQARL